MAKRFLKTLTNNIGFKLLALFFGFVLWVVVYNIDDPIKTKSFTTNVTVENASAIANMNKYYEIIDGTNRVTFSVSAKRTILDKLDDGDFHVVADMNTLVVDPDGEFGSVELKILSDRYENSIKYNGKSKYLRVSLEDLMTKQFVIAPTTKGTVADGYALGDVVIAGSNILKVSGPASVVSRISAANATIDVDGVATSVYDDVIPILYAEDGSEVDTTKLTMNIQMVSIEATVLGTKEVPLVFTTIGDPAEGYEVISVTADPVRVKGNSSALNEVTTLNLPNYLLDVTGLEESFDTTLDISEYLPTGVSLVNKHDAKVTVTVTIVKYKTEVFSVPTGNIYVDGLNQNLELSFDSNSVEVTLGGTEDVIKNLKASGVALKLDASGLTLGSHTVQLELAKEDQEYSVISAMVTVTVKKPNTQSATSDESSKTETSKTEEKDEEKSDSKTSDSKTSDDEKQE